MKLPPVAQISAKTSASNSGESTLTMSSVDRLAEIVSSMPKEPFGEWMTQQGCPPGDWIAVIPEKACSYGGPVLLPSYVRVSPYIDDPVFIRKDAF